MGLQSPKVDEKFLQNFYINFNEGYYHSETISILMKGKFIKNIKNIF